MKINHKIIATFSILIVLVASIIIFSSCSQNEKLTSNKKINVTSVKLNKNTLSLILGNKEALLTSIEPSNATEQNVTWVSSDSTVATVSSTGEITAVKEGTSTIMATTKDGNKTATCIVTVNNPIIKATSIKLNKTTCSLLMWDTDILTATIMPSNATDQNITWSSSNKEVVTVSNAGRITAANAGTATITASTIDGSVTASCDVEVKYFQDNMDITSKFTDQEFLSDIYKIVGKVSPDPILYSDVKNITKLSIKIINNLSNFNGLEYFSSLTDFYMVSNYSDTITLDFSHNTALTSVKAGGNNKIHKLDVSNNVKLKYLELVDNSLEALDLSNNPELTYLDCSNNKLQSLDLSNNKLLTTLKCSNSQISKLDLTKNVDLTILDCSKNYLNELDLSKNTALKELNATNNQLGVLDLSKNTELTSLEISRNKLRELDLSANKKLSILDCTYNEIKTLYCDKDKWSPDSYALQYDDYNDSNTVNTLVITIK